MSRLKILALGMCLALASGLCLGGAAEADQQEDLDVIVRYDGRTVPPTKVIRDDQTYVIGKKGVEIKVPSCLVKEVIRGDKDGNYAAALEKRDEGRYTLAAMYFTKALTNMGKQAWAAEYCNYGIGNALYEDGKFAGYTGRSGTKYDAPAEYFKRTLDANPKSRYMLDILVKVPVCLAEQGKLSEADAAIKDAEAKIKAYRAETIPIAAEFGDICDRATAQLAIASARVAQRRVEKGEGKWDEAKDKWLNARFKAGKYTDLLGEAANGVLETLVKMKDYNGAKAEADAIIDKYKKEGERHLPLLPGAYTVLGQANLAQATEFETRGATIQAKQAYAEARWAFLHVVAQFFDNDEYVAGAHYFAGMCDDKLKDIESDAADKAVRHWQVVVEHFRKSDFREMAEKELTRVGAPIPQPEENKPAASTPSTPTPHEPSKGGGEKPAAKQPAPKQPAKKK